MATVRAFPPGILIALGTSASRLLGAARSIVLVTAIGSTGVIANSLGTASQVTNMVYSLVASGVLTSVLVPQVTWTSANTDRGETYVNRLVTFVLLGAGSVAVTTALLTPWLISWLGASWANTRQEQIATTFALWLAPQIFFFALYSALGEILNARNLFGPYAWTPVLSNIVGILGLVVFIVLFGSDPGGTRGVDDWNNSIPMVIAGSATLGVALQALTLFAFFRKAKVRYRPDFRFTGIGLGVTLRLGLWTFASVLATQVVSLLAVQAMNRTVANEAGVAAWQLTSLVGVLPHSIIVVSLVASRFTRMSAAAIREDFHSLRTDLESSARMTVISMTLVSLVLLLLSEPVTRLLMPDASVDLLPPVSRILSLHVLGILPFSVLYVFNRGFFALSNTRVPCIVQLLFSSLTAGVVALSYALPSHAVTASITLGSNLLFLVQATVTFTLLSRSAARVNGRSILQSIIECAISAVVAGLLGLGTLRVLGGVGSGSFATASTVGALTTCLLVTAIAGTAYVAMLSAFKTPEVKLVVSKVFRRNRPQA